MDAPTGAGNSLLNGRAAVNDDLEQSLQEASAEMPVTHDDQGRPCAWTRCPIGDKRWRCEAEGDA